MATEVHCEIAQGLRNSDAIVSARAAPRRASLRNKLAPYYFAALPRHTADPTCVTGLTRGYQALGNIVARVYTQLLSDNAQRTVIVEHDLCSIVCVTRHLLARCSHVASHTERR